MTEGVLIPDPYLEEGHTLIKKSHVGLYVS